jgi:hypothetical protein
LVLKYKANRKKLNSAGQIPLDVVSDPENPKWIGVLVDGEKISASKTPSKRAKDSKSTSSTATENVPTKPQAHPVINKMFSVLKTIKSAKDRTGRLLSEVFLELPSRDEYPDYFVTIEKPISLEEIEFKLKNLSVHPKSYLLPEFRADMTRMFLNAMFYNEEDSQIFVDAMTLADLFRKEIRKCDDTLVTTLGSVLVSGHPLRLGHFAVSKDHQVILIERAGKNELYVAKFV